MTNEPDVYTHEWYRKQFSECVRQIRGVSFQLNGLAADYEQTTEAMKELRQSLDTVKKFVVDAQAEIGRLSEENVELRETIEKARKAFQELKNGGSHDSHSV